MNKIKRERKKKALSESYLFFKEEKGIARSKMRKLVQVLGRFIAQNELHQELRKSMNKKEREYMPANRAIYNRRRITPHTQLVVLNSLRSYGKEELEAQLEKYDIDTLMPLGREEIKKILAERRKAKQDEQQNNS